MFGGIRIAASGELGVGVGEEDRGSGEREVLEGLVGRIDGLVDLLVSKFGDSDPDEFDKTGESKIERGRHPHAQWLGTGKEPGAEDGAIFLGVGALSRKSLRDITQWMEDIYSWGENAYGVSESPKATRRAHRAPRSENRTKPVESTMQVPPSLFDPTRGSKPANHTPYPQQEVSTPGGSATAGGDEETGGLEKYMDYLKLGYGKYWTLGGDSTPRHTESADSAGIDATTDSRPLPERRPLKGDDFVGHFLIGLTGEVEEGWIEDPEERRFAIEEGGMNARTVVRTLTVELETNGAAQLEGNFSKILGSQDTDLSAMIGLSFRRNSFDSQDSNKAQRLRVVVYIVKPFIFTFLFEVQSEGLAFEGLYRSLHHQVAPLRKLLAKSTAFRPDRPDMGNTAAIYDVVWDPKTVTVHSTIPNIPDTSDLYNIHDQPPWSRVEALNTHLQILNMWKSTRTEVLELERTCKTSRGWWIVWSRILERKIDNSSSSSTEVGRPSSSRDESSNDSQASGVNNSLDSNGSNFYVAVASASGGTQEEVSKEIFLIRKASDYGSGHGRSVSLASGSAWADGASRLAQGIGVDTRKYIEGLLSLNQ